MSDLTKAQRRAIIEAALGLLDKGSLATTHGGEPMLHQIRNAIEATLGDNCRADAVTRLLLAMAEASRVELLRQVGVTVAFDDEFARLRSDDETLQ